MTPDEHVALDIFVEALFDSHAEQSGLKPRWNTVREATRIHWRRSVAAAADAAWRSQFGPLSGERLRGAPDPFLTFAVELARTLGAARSRARTPAGVRRAMQEAGGKSFTLWKTALSAGSLALTYARKTGTTGAGPQLLLQHLPDLRRAA